MQTQTRQGSINNNLTNLACYFPTQPTTTDLEITQMKKLLSSVLALALVFGLSLTASAQSFTVNKTTIVGNGNQVNNVTQGFGGQVVNDTAIVGHQNAVTNLSQGVFGGQVVNQTQIAGNANQVNNLALQPVFPGSSVVNSTSIFGNNNAVNNLTLPMQPMMQPGFAPMQNGFAPMQNGFAPMPFQSSVYNQNFIQGHFNSINNIVR
jgi:hypothetical protein